MKQNYNLSQPKPKMLASANTGAIRVGMALGFVIIALLGAIS